jgi:hypothetical protein
MMLMLYATVHHLRTKWAARPVRAPHRSVFTKLSAGDKTYIHNAAWFPLFSSPTLEHHVRLYHAFCLDLICDQFFLVLALATPAHIEIDSLGFKPSFF